MNYDLSVDINACRGNRLKKGTFHDDSRAVRVAYVQFQF